MKRSGEIGVDDSFDIGGSPVDVALEGIGITLDLLLVIDKAWSTNTALSNFLADPTGDLESALVWAAECGSLLAAAGQVISYIPGPIGLVLSAPFQIPSKAIAAYSHIMVEYVAKVDAESGGSSSGAKIMIDGGGELRGDVIAIARGASLRQMGDVMSIIWDYKDCWKNYRWKTPNRSLSTSSAQLLRRRRREINRTRCWAER